MADFIQISQHHVAASLRHVDFRKPITNYAAMFMPPKGFQTTQMDMFSAEDIGLNKFDILSQRGLGHIRDCLNLIKKKGINVNIHDIAAFKKDERIKT